MSLEHSESRPATARSADGPNAINHMHDVFSNWERRAILYHLSERDEQADLDRIVEHVSAWRQGEESPADASQSPADVSPSPAEERSRLRSHVSQMDEFGILSYDSGEERVSLCEDVQVAVSPPWTGRNQPDPDAPPRSSESRRNYSD